MKLSEVPSGSRVRVVLEGTARHYTAPVGRTTGIDTEQGRVTIARAEKLDVEVLAPQWQEGDVVSYADATFVRGRGGEGHLWHGSNGWKAKDDEINARHELGQVTHLLREGRPVR
jgi:hypothetical protein